ncbi:hypothetical protein HCN44_001586 [Aphidius gifuensis]|uniref:Cuticular protein n=1 Tax=Aphidius gifuensis TaxID=684658 RepID=A0A834XSZ3_APHGI|nr:hypothetical protein HCN44_001586 [Aphidius gifuensis]
MKMFQVVISLAIFGMCYSARLDNTYLPPRNAGSAGGAGLIPAPRRGAENGRPIYAGGVGGGSQYNGGNRGVASGVNQNIPIVSYTNENNGDGNYAFSYETGNGINVQETGQSQGNRETVSGSYSYTGPDGIEYTIRYTADDEGFHAEGAHIPTPPPIPEAIRRGVELSLAAEARGENQDNGSRGQGNGYPRGSGRVGGSTYKGPNSYQTSGNEGYQY